LKSTPNVSSTVLSEEQKEIKEMENNEPTEFRGICFTRIKNYFYDLNKLNSRNGYFVKGKHGQIISFNFCKNIHTQCEENEGLVVSSSRCKKFAGSRNSEKVWIREEDSHKNTKLTLILPEGDICEKNRTSSIRYQTTFEITCDRFLNFVITNEKTFDTKKCQNTIKIRSRHGKLIFYLVCDTQRFRAWWNQFAINKKGVGVVLIIAGLYFLVFGAFFSKVNSLVINCSILGMILYSFINLFVPINIMICLLLGIALAIAVLYFEAANGMVLGVVVGYLFGNLFYNVLMKFIQVNPQTLYWGSITFFILFISLAGGFMKTYMVCLATALVGAYAFVRVNWSFKKGSFNLCRRVSR
jgi:hypothetical protein